jgi:hypothetical protein
MLTFVLKKAPKAPCTFAEVGSRRCDTAPTADACLPSAVRAGRDSAPRGRRPGSVAWSAEMETVDMAASRRTGT